MLQLLRLTTEAMYPSSEFLRCSMAHCQGLWRMRPVDALGRASPRNIEEDVPTLPGGCTGGSTGSASKTIPELAILRDRANVDGHSKVVDGRSKIFPSVRRSNGILFTRRRARSEDEALAGPSRAPPHRFVRV
jgi:hypothetical protein